jgi:hypothetical protein
MGRFYLCATVVAALLAVSYPAGALMFGAASTLDRQAAPAAQPLAAAPSALSPEGRPVRVISLPAVDRPAVAAVASAQPAIEPSASEPASMPKTKLAPESEQRATPVVVHSAELVRPAPKPAPLPRRSTRQASAPIKKVFALSALSSLY